MTEQVQSALDGHKVIYEHKYNLTEADLLREYFNCDILCFASLEEGFGMPIIEAQRVGRAVLTSNIGVMPEVAGQGALFVNPHDEASIRAGVERIISDSDLRDRLISAGFENAARFTRQNIVEDFIRVYECALKA